MNIYKIRKNKRAFSAIIAALILMLIAVAAGVVVYAYVMGWIGGAQQSSPGTGVITIDSMTANSTSGILKVYVRNSGSSDVTLDRFYFAGTAVTNATALTTSSAALPVHSTAFLQFTGLSIQASRSYEVKIVCADGTEVTQSVEAI